MSVPYGAPHPAPQRPAPPPEESAGAKDPKSILVMVAAAIGPVAYLFGFFDGQASQVFTGLAGFCMIAASTLAGLRLLPKPSGATGNQPAGSRAPDTLVAAAPLTAYSALALVQGVVHGGPGAVAIIILLLALAQVAAVAGVLLAEAGVVTLPGSKSAKSASFPQSGSFPRPGQPGPSGPGQPGAGQPAGPGQQGGPGHPSQPQPFGRPHQGQPAQGQLGGWSPQSGGSGQPSQSQPGGRAPQSGGPQTGGQQPVGWSGGGFAAPPDGPSAQPGSSSYSGQLGSPAAPSSPTEQPSQPGRSEQQGQTAQPEQFGQFGEPGGPQGTQQMPHPGGSRDS